MKVFAQWAEYPTQQGPYGSGGWSRNAKHKPQRVIKQMCGSAKPSGKSWIVNGVRKLKLNLWDLETGVCLRRDYPDFDQPAFLKEPILRAMHAANIAGESEPVL